MKIKKLPNVLAIHLKRFKFIETTFKKLSYRVSFPQDLRLFNTVSFFSFLFFFFSFLNKNKKIKIK